jgi:hypothetical protein
MVGCRQGGFVGIDDEHSKQARGFGSARVFAHTMTIARQFGKAFAGAIRCHWSIIDLASNRPLQDRWVDKGGVWMGVRWRRAAWLVFDEHALDALAGDVWKHVLVDQRHLRLVIGGIQGRCSGYRNGCQRTLALGQGQDLGHSPYAIGARKSDLRPSTGYTRALPFPGAKAQRKYGYPPEREKATQTVLGQAGAVHGNGRRRDGGACATPVVRQR